MKIYQLKSSLLIAGVCLFGCEEEVNHFEMEEPSMDVASSSDCNAPSTDADFTDALKGAKLQSSYLSSDQKDLEDWCQDFFYLDGNRMVLKNDDDEFDRTELRQTEDLSLGTWSRMRFKANLEDLPDGDGITFAQIHNDAGGVSGIVKRPLVKIYVRNGRIYAGVNSNYGDGSNTVETFDIVSYTEGVNVIVTVILRSDGNVKIQVKKWKKTYSITFTPDDNWNDSEVKGQFYFKTGLYSQEAGEKSTIEYNYLSW